MTGAVRVVAVVAVVLAGLAATVNPAAACSCALLDARDTLADADAAFVGSLVERKDGTAGPSSRVTLVFRVEHAVKGRLGETVEVETSASGASCGIEAAPGDRIGLFLFREGDAWTSNLCLQIAPEKLLAAARPLPAPTGEGPIVLLVGGRFGPVRTLSLDGRGRTLAYGAGKGETSLLALCPGSRRAVEVVAADADVVLALRDVVRSKVLRERRLPRSSPSAASCGDPAGDVSFVFSPGGHAVIVRIERDRVQTVWRGTARAAWLGPDRAYVTARARADTVLSVELPSGKATRLGSVPRGMGALVPSPDGRALAGIARGRVVVVEIGSGGTRVRSAPLGPFDSVGDVRWIANDRLVFLPNQSDVARVYDRSLRLRHRFRGWVAYGTAVLDGRAYGLLGDRLLWAPLPCGPVRTLVELPGPNARSILAVPGWVRIDRVPAPPGG